MERAPRATILLTSRERLRLQAEWLFDLEGLAYPPHDLHGSTAPQNPINLSDFSAIQLFVQRATQIQPNLDALATRLRDVPARHRSMRAVFDHSWGC